MSLSTEEKRNILLSAHEDNKYFELLGLEILELEETKAVGRIPFKKETLNPYGFMHGGALYSLADIVSGNLACMCGNYVTTATSSMNFIAPAINTKYIFVKAEIVHSGNHLIVVRTKIENDSGELLDEGSFTFFKSKISMEDSSNMKALGERKKEAV